MREISWFCTKENKWHFKGEICKFDVDSILKLEKKITTLHAKGLLTDDERYFILNQFPITLTRNYNA